MGLQHLLQFAVHIMALGAVPFSFSRTDINKTHLWTYVFKQNSVESGQHNVDPAQMMERNASARKLILNFRETRAWTKVQGKWFIVNHSAFAAAGNQRRAVKRTRPVSE